MSQARVIALTGFIVLALTTAGCGGSASDKASGPQNTAAAATSAPRAWDESEVMRLARIETDDEGLSYRLTVHPDCTAAVILVTKSMVETYGGAGDTVATNPDGTAGVKVTGQERATCLRQFTEALSAVK